MTPLYFRDVNAVPPGGFFYETHGVRVTGRTFVEIEPKVRRLMYEFRIPGLPEAEIAGYMCPRMDDPGRYCKGPDVPAAGPRPREALDNSLAFCSRPVVTFDRIARRIEACTKCPRHTRPWCPTCTGHPAQILARFGGARPSLPADRASGICRCTAAYELAMASVEYGKDEPVWEGAPDTCWRRNDV